MAVTYTNAVKIARQNAVQKLWPLMGYALKERLSGEL